MAQRSRSDVAQILGAIPEPQSSHLIDTGNTGLLAARPADLHSAERSRSGASPKLPQRTECPLGAQTESLCSTASNTNLREAR